MRFSFDQRKLYLKRRTLKNIDVNRGNVQNTFYVDCMFLSFHLHVLE